MAYTIQRGIFTGPDYLIGPMLTRHKTLNRVRSYCNRMTPLQRGALRTALEDKGLSSLPIYAESYPWKFENGRWLYACIIFSTKSERVQAINYLTNGCTVSVHD